MRAFISDDDERRLIVSEDEDFVASYVYGEWFENKLVDIDRMRELDEEQDYEMGGLLRQAKKALSLY
jgi:hypothetical protein